MSLKFNGANTNEDGIVQMYEDEIGANPGDISGSPAKLKKLTSRVNLAFDKFLAVAFPPSGTWQFDDYNHTDFPVIKTNIESGRRDYTFTEDGSGNLILDIYKVAILPSATATEYEDIHPVDTQSQPGLAADFNSSRTGVPSEYDKTANGILFRTTPNYNATNGLLVYINREASRFVYTDTTKMPGVPGLFHDWFFIQPAEEHARRNSLPTYVGLRDRRMQLETDIRAYFGRRERDVRKQLTAKPINFR